jgi:GAF domain-containing protein
MYTGESYFRALNELSKELGTTEDQGKMLHLIVSKAVKTLKVKAAAIFLMDKKSEDDFQNVAEAQVGLSSKYVHAGTGFAVKISPQLLKDGYLYYENATTDKRLANRDAKKAEGIGSMLSVPVMDRGCMVGILSVYTKEIRKFRKDEIDFLSILAEQGGSAVEISYLIQKLRKSTQIFLKLAASISESLNVKTILQAMTQDLVESLDIKAASVLLLEEDQRTLKRVACFGLSEKYMNKGPVRADKNIAEALKGKTIAINNVFEDKGIQYKEEKKEEGIVSMLYVPIKAKDSIIGVMLIYSGKERNFSEDEILLVTALAYQGGLAINNACIYMDMQDDIKDLRENIWSHKCWF